MRRRSIVGRRRWRVGRLWFHWWRLGWGRRGWGIVVAVGEDHSDKLLPLLTVLCTAAYEKEWARLVELEFGVAILKYL